MYLYIKDIYPNSTGERLFRLDNKSKFFWIFYMYLMHILAETDCYNFTNCRYRNHLYVSRFLSGTTISILVLTQLVVYGYKASAGHNAFLYLELFLICKSLKIVKIWWVRILERISSRKIWGEGEIVGGMEIFNNIQEKNLTKEKEFKSTQSTPFLRIQRFLHIFNLLYLIL